MSLIGDQFTGLPMHDLIGGPLMAACDAQLKLANVTANFIKTVGFLPPDKDGNSDIRSVKFAFDRPAQAQPPAVAGAPATTPTTIQTERVELDIPLLAIVKVPSLFINTVDIVFEMEVKNSESHEDSAEKSGTMTAEMSAGWGPFSVKVNMSGSMSTHQANTPNITSRSMRVTKGCRKDWRGSSTSSKAPSRRARSGHRRPPHPKCNSLLPPHRSRKLGVNPI
jgi:hypothetical protein